ncbi:MAG: tRNA guanosine(15) transglycosylase TgtA [Euryarchaeota archaeon]|nr:tRNA guanosine(15) transglycosylase TgtA [Euryarchaeota archaeon]
MELIRRDGLARICRLHTRRGELETPCLLPVINPRLITIAPRELYDTFGFRAIITNSYIIRNDPRIREDALARGLHDMLDFPGVIMTDSGTFQSHMYGEVDLINREIVEFQRDIGSDIGTVLDIFAEPDWSKERTAASIDITLERSREAARLKGEMLLAGVVQGSVYPDLREMCARRLSEMDIDVNPVGGVVPLMENYRFSELVDVIVAAKKGLRPDRPVHLFGAGHPMLFALAVLLGCDMFDSASYAKFARDDRFMFLEGTFRIQDMKALECNCPACTGHDLEEVRALPPAKRTALIARHNLWTSKMELERVKRAIMEGDLWELVERRCRSHPALLDALRGIGKHQHFLERYEPLSRDHALFYTGAETFNRPAFLRFRKRLIERYEHPATEVGMTFEEPEKPYSRTLRPAMDSILAISDAHFQVISPFGPVPIELDEVYPISQSLFPKDRDQQTRERTDRMAEELAHGHNYKMGAVWDGEETLDFLKMFSQGSGGFDIDMARVRAVADYQFGKGAAEALLDGKVSLVKSRNVDRIRNVLVDGEHVVSMRAEDGFYTLKLAGARRLLKGLPSPHMRVVVQDDSVEFNRQGRNVFCSFVTDADPEIRLQDEVMVVDKNDALVAIGRAQLTRDEMLCFQKGVAVKVREGA